MEEIRIRFDPAVVHGTRFKRIAWPDILGQEVDVCIELDSDQLGGTVAFDRNGYRYHGRIKSLADGAREGGLKL